MLRAVWLGDKLTFDRSWNWTKNNLQKSTKIFSWIYGKRSDGTLGVLTDQGGQNSAPDADTDIALALIFASKKWKDPSYLDQADEVIQGIWNDDVAIINGRPYLAADDIEKTFNKPAILADPSYFEPYAYRIFSAIDKDHQWMSLVDTSYEVLNASMDENLDKASSADIPPEWVLISNKDGSVSVAQGAGLTSDTGYGAARIPWRLYLDWSWFGDQRDELTLNKMNFFSRQWQTDHLLFAVYHHDGGPSNTNESLTMYGGTMGYFLIADSTYAREIFENKLLSLYNPDSRSWRGDLGYYDSNWLWFGVAMYQDQLPNLAAGI